MTADCVHELPPSFWTDPLMYQGGSDSFVGPRDPVYALSEDWGIDLEAEVAVVTGDVSMGCSVADAAKSVRLLMLVNDPGLRNPHIFRGSILTYYGRWTYKLEEAARRGAAGVLLLHNDTMATYGWATVRNSWTGDQVRLESPPTSLA